MGILFTAVFFFFSGYGLVFSYENKPDYLRNFLSHRLPVILIPFWVSGAIYVLARIYISGVPTKGFTLFKCLSGLILLNGNGWYIVEIFWLYLAFYIFFKLIKKKDLSLVLLSIFTLALIVIALYSGHDYTEIGGHWFKGEWWYNSTITFVMGTLFARFRSRITAFLEKKYRLLLPITIILFFVIFAIEEVVRNVFGYYHESLVVDGINDKVVTLIAQSILCIIFVFLVLLVNMKITIGNKALKALSVISTELFLIHNLFLHSVFDFTHVRDFWIYAIVLMTSVPAAVLMHYFDAPIISTLQRLLSPTPKDYIKECEADSFREKRDRRRRSVKLVAIIIIVAAIIISALGTVFYNFIKLPSDFKKETATLEKAKIGDIVKLGRFETDYLLPGKEKLEWIVLSKNENELVLITKNGIDSCVYYASHTEVDWNNSYVRTLLNDTLYDQMFSKYEKNIIIADSDNGDFITLLTPDEALTYFKDDATRQLAITPVAEKLGANINNMSKVNYWDSKGYRSSWWWLKGDGPAAITAPIVTVDGTVVSNEKYVNKPYGAVRPVVRIKL